MEKFWGHIFDRLRFHTPLIILLLLIIFPVLVSARFVLLGILTSFTLAITAFFAFGIEVVSRRAPPSSLRVSPYSVYHFWIIGISWLVYLFAMGGSRIHLELGAVDYLAHHRNVLRRTPWQPHRRPTKRVKPAQTAFDHMLGVAFSPFDKLHRSGRIAVETALGSKRKSDKNDQTLVC